MEMYNITLFHWTLLHLAPCMDMHGFALVYMYTSANPCISMHGAKWSRVQWNRVMLYISM